MDLPQSWLPPPALSAGPATSGCRSELRSQSQSLPSATRLYQVATLALALMAALVQVDAQKMKGAQCGAHRRTHRSISFLHRSTCPLSRCLQSPQKQHQVCRDRRLEAGSTNCVSEKTTAWAGSPYRATGMYTGQRPLQPTLGICLPKSLSQTSRCPAVRTLAPLGLCSPGGEGRRRGNSRGDHEKCVLRLQLKRMDSLQKQELRRPKIHGAVQVSPYQPPTLASLQRLLWVRRTPTLTHINEVWPNLFLGDAMETEHRYAARDKSRLIQLGITHVVNVAAGKFQVDTGAKFYRGTPLEYYGIEADDNPFFDLSVYFLPVARYIRDALNTPRSRVLVHCAMGLQVLDNRLRRETGRL
uniref:dual specificity protein phosphatase 13 isoform X6 n=1 Tax=Arvicanthis niloticus TaxID=61156 RepID=UPI001486E73B|nr:dual specificity protein phosphatase 13 isoform X6 [Arvicanthis niloticus]